MVKEFKRPKEIWYSLYAFLGTIPVTIGEFLLTAFRQEIDLSLWDIKVYLLELTITVFIMLLIFRRKNSARIVYTVLTGLIVLGVFLARKEIIYGGMYSSISLFLQVCLRLLSVHFLFVKQSREWFKPSFVVRSTSQSEIDESMIDSNPFLCDDVKGVDNPCYSELNPSATEITPTERLWFKLKEKRKALLAGGLVLFACLLIVSIYIGSRAKKIAAIRSALIADATLARQLFGTRSMADSNEKTLQAYTQGLRRIDMSCCPRDFQLAYLDHIQAWESLARSRASVDLLGPLIEYFLLKKMPNIPDNSDEQPINDEIARTWDKIERIALSYGVRVSSGNGS